ncbi:esterase family protein [Rhodococcus zopfii]|uniref:Esterase family protein n=1 Tax=Rhodococcus zopfii TaxID=43772 RepID=A0ABU3WM58_9NOCA|nr:esterase family protein [Rhodococcus zopfii]
MTRTAARTALLVVSALLAAVFPALGTAAADPVLDRAEPLASPVSANGSHITRIEVRDEQSLVLYAYSGAMDREIPLEILRPGDTGVPRPTLYLLNGAGGGEDGATWSARTDAASFLADKNVNVVTPMAGKWSYYTDWQRPDPVLGVNKWTTFLTEELPPLIDAGLGTNGVNAIAGLSSSGTSVLQLPIAKPGLYRGVAAYSGCAQTSDPVGQAYVNLAVETWGGGNTENMWGPPTDPAWVENDPYVNAEKLRGLALYLSNGSGLPGRYDTLDGPDIDGDVGTLANQVVVGGIIEAATNGCTHNMARRLGELNIPATVVFRDTGTHSWGYWRDDLENSWPVLAGALGV